MLSKEALEVLSKMEATKLKYLAELVDWDTTGDKDDLLYLLLMEAWNETIDDEEVTSDG